VIIADAGSVLVFNGHLWHGGTRKETDRPRRVLQCRFIARDLVRPSASPRQVPDRLAPPARYILGA
jgi:ectoine hydroxylase-related dioxygenase (phytanoyl-CoA dioxygenase family)